MGNKDSKFQPGNILYRTCNLKDGKGGWEADHYGVYIGGDKVIHFVPCGIVKESLDDFAKEEEVYVRSYQRTRPRDQIVKTAINILKREKEWGEYSLVTNNCEHFASFCATGEKISGQVKKVVNNVLDNVAKIALDIVM